MKTPLWIPSEDKIKNANLTRFLTYVNKKHQKDFRTYAELYQWSIENIPDFWARFWEFADIKASRGYDQVVDDVRKMPGAKWFSGARLNFAENLLRYRDDRPAFIFRGETQKKRADDVPRALHRRGPAGPLAPRIWGSSRGTGWQAICPT